MKYDQRQRRRHRPAAALGHESYQHGAELHMAQSHLSDDQHHRVEPPLAHVAMYGSKQFLIELPKPVHKEKGPQPLDEGLRRLVNRVAS